MDPAELEKLLAVCARFGVVQLRTPDGLEFRIGQQKAEARGPIQPDPPAGRLPVTGWDPPTTFDELRSQAVPPKDS